MTSFRKIIPAALCAIAVAGAAVPASAEPFHGGWGHGGGGPGWHGGGWHDHDHGWGAGRALAFGGLGFATGALIANAVDRPVYVERPVEYVGPSCGETVRTHYDAYGRLVKVITQDPC